MTATAESAQEPADAPNTLEIAENPATGIQRTGNGIVVNGPRVWKEFGAPFDSARGSVMGRRRPATERKRQAEAFANTCHELLLQLRDQMGMNKPKPTPDALPANGQTNGKAINGEQTCESDSRQSAFASLKEASAVAVNLTRGWDTALERWRIEAGRPDPGCRRPGEPMPKSRKPTNRAPDSLACGSDTPTGSVPSK